jgi:hypothetical protein
MDADYREYLVTVRHDEHRTQDFPIISHCAWAAGAQLLQKRPGSRIVAIRRRYRDISTARDQG